MDPVPVTGRCGPCRQVDKNPGEAVISTICIDHILDDVDPRHVYRNHRHVYMNHTHTIHIV